MASPARSSLRTGLPRIYHHYNIFLPAGKAGRRYARQGAWRQRGLPQGVALPLPSDDAEGAKNQGAARGLPPDGRSAKRGFWSARADWRTPAKRPARFPYVQYPNSARRTAAINHGYSARSGATPASRDVHSGHRQKNASPSPKRSWQNVQVMPSPPTPLLTVLLRFIRRAAGSCVATGKFSMARFPAPRQPKRGFCATAFTGRIVPGGKMAKAGILRNLRCAFAACASTLGLRGATASRAARAEGQNGRSGHLAQQALCPRRMRGHAV